MSSDKVDLSKIIAIKDRLSAMQATPRAALGKGISALISDAKIDNKHKVIDLNVDELIASPFQARKLFVQEELEALATSIKEKGVLQPIIVRIINIGNINKYQIVAGERRVRASKLANLKEIPAIVMELTDKQVNEFGSIENLQRSDLNTLEEAQSYNNLMLLNYTQEEIAKLVGKSRAHISHYLRILKLPTEVLKLLQEEKITAGHAKALISSANPLELAHMIVENNFNVRQTEVAATKPIVEVKTKVNNLSKARTYNTYMSTEILNWLSKAKEKANVKIVIAEKSKGWEIKIKYTDETDLKDILKI